MGSSNKAKEAYLKDTENTPAARAGFDPDVRWNQHLMHQDFKKHRDAGTLEDFARLYPESQTAKRLREAIPYGRPIDF